MRHTNYGRSFSVALAVTTSLFSIIPAVVLQEIIIHFLNRVQRIADYMAKVDERKKLLLGATVGAALCLLIMYALR